MSPSFRPPKVNDCQKIFDALISCISLNNGCLFKKKKSLLFSKMIHILDKTCVYVLLSLSLFYCILFIFLEDFIYFRERTWARKRGGGRERTSGILSLWDHDLTEPKSRVPGIKSHGRLSAWSLLLPLPLFLPLFLSVSLINK